MARVTKINVGGTNYDIAHEGELKNSGFEVVTSLPTTGLFAGREVMYQGKKYVYSTFYKSWVVEFNEKASLVYNVLSPRGFYEILGYNYSLYQNTINRSYLSKYINYCNYTDDFLIETSVDNETFSEIKRTDKAYQIFNSTNSYMWNVANYSSIRLTVGYGRINLVINSFYINHVNIVIKKIKIDQQLRSDLSWEAFGEVDFTSVNPKNTSIWVSLDMFSKLLGIYGSIYKLRFTLEIDVLSPTKNGIINIFLVGEDKKYLTGINNYFSLSYKLLDCYSTIDYPITLNYDVANIEPTQTGEVEKKANWVLRYLLQGVNWLKANKVALSVYNAKVAELVQADSSNNAYIQSVKEELTALIDEVSGGLAALAAVARSGSYNDLTDKPTFSGSYNDLTDKPAIPNSFTDLSGTISPVQIPDGLIANAKLANSSMSLNGTTLNLGDTAVLPWYVDYNEVDYPARIRDHWLQIYRNGVWANLMYLGDILPTQVGQITSFDNLNWYNEQVSEYEVDSNTTTSILNGTTSPAAVLLNCSAEQLTLNLYPISGKEYGKGSLDSLILDLQGKGFSVFVENDLDAILASGNDYLVRIKISKVPTPKAIIECYVAR